MPLSLRRLAPWLAAIVTVLAAVTIAQALDLPDKPAARVNDYARVLDNSRRESLENELARFEQETSNQIVVAIFPSLGTESLEDYAVRLFDKWNLGQKGRSNGVLLVVFMAEKKIRIEVGYGLEPVLTDALGSRIIRNEMAPQFQDGHPDLGIVAGVAAIEKATRGEYKALAPAQRKASRGNGSPGGWVPFALFIFIVILNLLGSAARRGPVVVGPGGRRRRSRNDWWGGGGGFGGMGGGFGGGGGGGFGGGGGGGFSGGGGSSGGGGASGGW